MEKHQLLPYLVFSGVFIVLQDHDSTWYDPSDQYGFGYVIPFLFEIPAVGPVRELLLKTRTCRIKDIGEIAVFTCFSLVYVSRNNKTSACLAHPL